MKPFFSVIVPVFNRPDELEELLISLKNQSFDSFELVVVEDGSADRSEHLVTAYSSHFPIQYVYQDNTGPAVARNHGMSLAQGSYMLFVDSDCIAPEDWLESLFDELEREGVDCFGGPDLAAPNFSLLQKAISFAMTSFLTTGGIRGGKKQVGKFHPRSFNMGVHRSIYESLGGFPATNMHPGEDMVFTIELLKRGFSSRLFPEAGVYHKRRNTLSSFYKQVFKFGKTRYIISKVYPETAKIVFWAPTVLVLGGVGLLAAGALVSPWFLSPMALYFLLIFLSASWPTRCSQLGLLSMLTSAIQILGYGLGFLQSVIKVALLHQDEYNVFDTGFYPTSRKN